MPQMSLHSLTGFLLASIAQRARTQVGAFWRSKSSYAGDADCGVFFVLAPARVATAERCITNKNESAITAVFIGSASLSACVGTRPTSGTIYAAVTSFSARVIAAWSICIESAYPAAR